MRARPASRHALILACLLGGFPALADDPPGKQADVKPPGSTPTEPAAEPVAPASPAEADHEREATRTRLESLGLAEEREKPATKPLVEVLQARLALIEEWKKANQLREDAEKPKRTPEAEAAELKAELEKTRALLDQSAKAPDALLPEVFQVADKEMAIDSRRPDAKLAEMKEAIDSARSELKEQNTKLESLRTEGSRALAAEMAALRLERDKVFQGLAALNAQRTERRASLAATASGDARDLAREKLINLDWQARLESVRLAEKEARAAVDSKRIDLGSLRLQARSTRVELSRKLAERMEARYAALSERRRVALKRDGDREEALAKKSVDPLQRWRARRSAQLLELESQVVAYEKTYATTSGASIQEQASLKDKTVTDFEELKKLLDDGSVSPLDALRLKNDFRRIGPERAQIVRTDLAVAEAELTAYENALTDAEIDLVNDSRDDRFDREALLEQLPAARRAEAEAVLDDLETRHRGLLNRRRNVLRNLARRAEEAHDCVVQRIRTLDEQYAFIRTHIFWIRDAEPLGALTLAHARDDAIRAARAVVHLAMEASERPLWARPTPTFFVTLVALVILPVPMFLGGRAFDHRRLVGVGGPLSAVSGQRSAK